MAIINGLMLPLNSYLIQKIIDNALFAYQSQTVRYTDIIPLLILLAICMLIQNSHNIIDEFINIHLSNTFRLKYCRVLAEKYCRLKYEVFEDENKKNILSRIGNDPTENVMSYLSLITDFLSQIISIIGVLYLLSNISIWIIFPVIFVFLLFLKLDYVSVEQEIQLGYDQTAEERLKGYFETLMSSKETSKEIRSNQLQDYLLDQWTKVQMKLQNQRYKLKLNKRVRNHGIVRILAFLVNASMLVLFSFFVYDRIMSVGQLIAYLSAISSVLVMAMWEVPKTISNFRQNQVYWKDYAQFNGFPEYLDATDTEYVLSDDPEISFRNISFTYPNTEAPILKNFSLTFHLSERIALAGENGCGKSTLIKLLTGLYEPTEGEILVDNVPLNRYSIRQRKLMFSVVFQDFTNFHLSVRETIGIADTDCIQDDKRIFYAAQKGLIDDFIQTLPKKYDTLLGNIYEDGMDLSGGQWQRLAIARAYVVDSKMKILDEPTASLDPRAENALYEEALRINQGGILIVTHRLGITKYVDRIIVLHEGCVEEDGTHIELMKKNGIYKTMYNSQAEWYRYDEME